MKLRNIKFYAMLTVILSGISACATPPPVEGIKSFSASVDTQMKATVTVLKKYNSDIDLVKAEHRSVANAGAFYEYKNDQADCEVTDPLAADLKSPGLVVASRCTLIARVRDPSTRERKNYDVASGMTEQEQQLLSAKGLASDVQNYAKALNDIATSTDNDAITKSLTNALNSSKSAADSIAKLGGEEGLRTKVGSAIAGGTGVFSAAIQTGLDAARSNALRKAVIGSDEVIDNAARQLAILLYEHEKKDLLNHQIAFKKSYIEQIKNADPSVPIEKRTGGHAALVAKRKALIDADMERLSLQVLDIAKTHHAIYLSYTEPGNTAAYNAAQKQILDLVNKTDSFVKQVEDL